MRRITSTPVVGGVIVGALAALWLAACSEPSEAGPRPEPEPPAPTRVEQPDPDPERGREWMAHFECNRCHEGTGMEPAQAERQCVGCHEHILDGSFDAPPAHLRRWRTRLHTLNHAPSLENLQLRAAWVADFLLDPVDVRPHLPATMPRLRMTTAQALDIAAALSAIPTEDGPVAARRATPERIERGLALLEERGCRTCHVYSGATSPPARLRDADRDAAHVLAPDLRHTRARMTRADVLRWLRDPSAVRPGTLMPSFELSEDELGAIADAIFHAPLADTARGPMPERLALLERPVSFEEIRERVLTDTCWHCHADPDFAHGDGGPGNTGGFGFEGRGVVLMDYAGISTGYLDEQGERRSLFALDEDGTPHLVRVLMARHAEEAGTPWPDVTGMPLGLPPVPLEDIQLLESWIAQGRPR